MLNTVREIADQIMDQSDHVAVSSEGIEKIAKDNPNVQLEKVNVDENPTLAQEYGIQSIPTLVFLKDGKEVDRSIGVIPSDNILDIISKIE